MDWSRVETKQVLVLASKLKIVNVLCVMVAVVLCFIVAFRYVSLYYDYTPNYHPENEATFYNALNLDFWMLSVLGLLFVYGVAVLPLAARIIGIIGGSRIFSLFALVPVVNVAFVQVLEKRMAKFLEEN